MAVTISTYPIENITNDPKFTVVTSLTESASYQNVRIRAQVYMGGVTNGVISIAEQPKGLNNWDFWDILKDISAKNQIAPGGSESWIRPTFGSQLITGWTNYGSNFETFTTNGREITSAIDSDGSSGQAVTNDLGLIYAGEQYVFMVESDLTLNAGIIQLVLLDQDHNIVGSYPVASVTAYGLRSNHIYFITLPSQYDHHYIGLSSSAYANFSGTFALYKISDFQDNPCIYFRINFIEVYEDTNNITQSGDYAFSDSYLFVPAIMRGGQNFANFRIDAASKNFLTRHEHGTGPSIGLYVYNTGMELRYMFVSATPYGRLTIVTDYGSEIDNDVPNPGWGIAVINDNVATFADTDESFGITFASIILGGAVIYTGAAMVIPCDLVKYANIAALSFIGDLGEETLVFRGLETIKKGAEKSYYMDENNIRSVRKATPRINRILRTLYEVDGVLDLVHELICTEKEVWMYDETLTNKYRVVTVVSDEVTTVEKRSLVSADIEIEYYE